MLRLSARPAAFAAALVTAALPAFQSRPAGEPATALAALTAAGPGTTVALYPVRVLGRPDRMVRDALGLVLERRGMTSLETPDEAFAPAEGADWTQAAAQFAAFVQRSQPKASYALYAEYLGDRKTGPTEVRWVLAERGGALLLADRQMPDDPDFQRTAARDPDPLGCSALVGRRLFARIGWRELPTETGSFTRRWAAATGLPDPVEQEAMAGRLRRLRDGIASTSIEIHATRIGARHEAASTKRLQESIAQRLACTTLAAPTSATVAIQPTPNQQKHLWDLARGFRDFVKAHPPKAGYALLVDILGDPAAGRIGGVQLVVCDQAGDWVLADFQNDQHPDFQRVKPASLEDCERLAVERLVARLR
jgi:hypothetical protein